MNASSESGECASVIVRCCVAAVVINVVSFALRGNNRPESLAEPLCLFVSPGSCDFVVFSCVHLQSKPQTHTNIKPTNTKATRRGKSSIWLPSQPGARDNDYAIATFSIRL